MAHLIQAPRQVVPGLGVRQVRLLGKAAHIYQALETTGELARLRDLDHLGALTFAFPGMVHSRWDYAMTAAYLAGFIKPKETSAEITLGPLDPMSYREAAQWVVLLNNVGHLPGTFASEKGVLRFLTRKNRLKPLDLLAVPQLPMPKLRHLNQLAIERDYAYFNRALGIIKCFGTLGVVAGAEILRDAAEHLLLPFYCPGLRGDGVDWQRLRDLVSAIQRLAYLTIDASYVSVPSVSIPALIQPLLSNDMLPVGPLPLTDDEVNLVRAYDQLVYETVYHAPASRAISAIVTSHVDAALRKNADPAALIWNWESQTRLSALIGAAQPDKELGSFATLSFRVASMFIPARRPASAELELRRLGGPKSHVSHLTYRAWSPGTVLRRIEADNLLVDLLVPKDRIVQASGRLLAWIFRRYDQDVPDPTQESVPLIFKEDLEDAYIQIVHSALTTRLPCDELRVVPWPDSMVRLSGRWRVVATGSASSAIAKYVFGSRLQDKRLTPRGRDQYHEYKGLREIWRRISQSEAKAPKGKESLVILFPASFALRTNNKNIAEFDGAVVTVERAKGSVRFYLAESKRGETNSKALKSVSTRLAQLGLVLQTSQFRTTPFGAYATFDA